MAAGTVPPLGPATGSPVFYGGVDFHGEEPLRQLRDAAAAGAAGGRRRGAVRLGLGLVVVVFSDGSLNRIELHQAAMGYPLTATAVDRMDIPVLAEPLGCDGVRVENVSGLEKALSTAFSERVRPLVIEARIDTSQYAVQY